MALTKTNLANIVEGVLPVANGGTGTTTSTGTGSVVLSNNPTFASETNSGNYTFTGTGNRILGDFSNGTIASRVAFQTSTANSTTIVNILPSGTGTEGRLTLLNNSDPTLSSGLDLRSLSTEAMIRASTYGGSYLPLTMSVGGSERLRVGTAGQLGIGGANYGTSGQVLTSGGSGAAPSWVTPAGITSGTAVSASGTSIAFTSIPSSVKRISLLFNATETNGAANAYVQLGTGGTPTTSGYLSTFSRVWSSVNRYDSTDAFLIPIDNDGMVLSGIITFANISGNTWICSGVVAQTNGGGTTMSMQGGGTVTLGGVLNYLRVTTANGTDSYNAGTLNIFWE
jgi:hypothetical protein